MKREKNDLIKDPADIPIEKPKSPLPAIFSIPSRTKYSTKRQYRRPGDPFQERRPAKRRRKTHEV